MSTEKVLEAVEELIDPVLQEQGCELVDLEYLQEGGRWILRIFVDLPGGITLEDCARLSREIGDLLDIRDVVEHEYVLEVSSPGLDRPLRKAKHFEGAIGKRVRIATRSPVEGRKNFQGVLETFTGDTLQVAVDKHTFQIPLHVVRKANLIYEFDD
ncbi:ribosome maturation factor RimP [Desulfatiglans anilini]|uniref:ribosome maturation factor RimP n=1 Tax=Desulfatiglans anilini TaxID=90728 RepID=UPI0004854DAE|nr:ribosome maturation factor RimP [Desulfatiglans anilini]